MIDIELIQKLSSLPVPVIVSGGAGSTEHIMSCIKEGHADAVAVASLLHYDKMTIKEIKQALQKQEIPVRQIHG